MSQLKPEFDDETLVSFLDGELPTEVANKLVLQMSTDAELKRRVDELRASWELLEELPVANPNPQLAQTTIELIALGMGTPKSNGGLGKLIKRFRWLAAAVASLLAIAGGAWISSWQAKRFTQSIVDDLPVLTNYRDLDNIDSHAWLEKLAEIKDLENAGLPLSAESAFPELPVHSNGLESWVNELDTNQKLALQTAYSSFRSADPARQIVLRTIASELADPVTGKNAKLIKAYAGLRRRISGAESAQIEAEQDLELRAAHIQNVVYRELAINYANNLSNLEKSLIIEWCDDLKLNNLDFLNINYPDVEIVRLLDVGSIDADDIQALINCVNPEGRELLDRLDASIQTKVLKLWVYNSLPSKPQYTTAEKLERFYKLPVDVQNELIYAPGNEVIRTLSQDPTQPSAGPDELIDAS